VRAGGDAPGIEGHGDVEGCSKGDCAEDYLGGEIYAVTWSSGSCFGCGGFQVRREPVAGGRPGWRLESGGNLNSQFLFDDGCFRIVLEAIDAYLDN
jgi:hypothetical protein